MNILLTGASGFLGQILFKSLSQNHNIDTIGRSKDAHIQADLTDFNQKVLEDYDLLIHNAGKAHVISKNDEQVQDFFKVNVEGTKNLMNNLKGKLGHLVFISTVAVYGDYQGTAFTEDDLEKGNTPYASSKLEAERYIENWCKENNVKFTILRLPLVAGKNPPGNLGAIIQSIKSGYYFRVGKGRARRSMVLGTDVANLIASGKLTQGKFNLTDGHHPQYREIDSLIGQKFNKSIRSIPKILLQLPALIGNFLPGFPINSYRLEKLTSDAIVSDAKARKELSWSGRSVVEHPEEWL